MADHSALSAFRLGLRRLGLRVVERVGPTVDVAGYKLSSTRIEVDGLSWLQVTGVPAGGRSIEQRYRDLRVMASLTDRLPAVGVVVTKGPRRGEIDHVRMPGWAFVALLKMVSECDLNHVSTTLNEYLPLGQEMSQKEREMMASICSTLESNVTSSNST